MPKRVEDEAEYQRKKARSQDERDLEARDRCAKRLHDQNVRDGKNTTYDEAHRECTRIAEQVRRKEEQEGKR